MITVIKSTRRLSHLSWLLLTLWLQATTFAFAGTLTLTDSNGDAYQLTIVDEVLLRPDGSVSVPISESVTGVPNIPPVAHDDNAVAFNDHSIELRVTNNDIDQDGDYPLFVVLEGDSYGGTFTRLPFSDVRFTPDAGFVGTATQQYRVIDTSSGISTRATIYVEVTENSCPDVPLAGWELDTSFTEFGACNFGAISLLSLSDFQYFAPQLIFHNCSPGDGRIYFSPWQGLAHPLRLTISRCPGVFDDSYAPIPTDPFSNLCSNVSVTEGFLLWETLLDDAFTCRVLPSQPLYLNIAYGNDGNPPSPTCGEPECDFYVQPLED